MSVTEVHSCNEGGDAKLFLKLFTVLIAVAGAYLARNFLLTGVVDWLPLIYVVQPILWVSVAALTLVISRYSGSYRLRFHSGQILPALLIGVFSISVQIAAGLTYGFGRSPYILTPRGILMNIALIAGTLAGMELSRAYLVRVCSRRFFALGVVFVTVLYAVASLSATSFAASGDTRQLVLFLLSKPLPLLAQSFLATILALVGSPLASIAYLGTMQSFEWFSPILPNVPWTVSSLIGVVIPILGVVITAVLNRDKLPGSHTASTEDGQEERGSTAASVAGWVAIALFGVIAIWFVSGQFGPVPTLVVSRSMEPAIKLGDIVVTTSVTSDDVKAGDVIRFRSERGFTIHRVVKVMRGGNSTLFVTKGDANTSADPEPVQEEQVTGKVKFTVPKVGWAAIGIKNTIGSLAGGK